MPRRYQIFVAIALIILGTVFYIRLRTPDSESAAQATTPHADLSELDYDAVVEQGQTPTPPSDGAADSIKRLEIQAKLASMPALPSLELPFSAQAQTLLDRHKAGDPEASCRLLRGLARCREEDRNYRYSMAKFAEMELNGTGNPEYIRQTKQQLEETRLGANSSCKGIELEQLPPESEILATSLPFLSVQQKSSLAMSFPDGTLRRLVGPQSPGQSANYVFPQFLADHTLEFLQEGFEAADPLALEGLVLLHAPGITLGPRGAVIWIPNPKLFLKYALMMESLFGSESLGRRASGLMRQTAESLSQEIVQRVQQEAGDEVARWRKNAGGADFKLRSAVRRDGSCQ